MPYESIEEAKTAKFATTAEKVSLTLAQINHLAKIYDAIKKAGNADNPMALAWTQWKEIYKKEGDKWVQKETQKGVSEAFVTSEPEWLSVAKVGQKINYKDGSGTKTLTEEALKNAQGTWKGKPILKNHGEVWDNYTILDEKVELPFLYVKVDTPVEAALRSNETTGASVDVDGMGVIGEELTSLQGTGLSVLWDRVPACTPEMGCASVDVNSEDYHEGGGKEKMGKEGEDLPVTYTGKQAKEMIASAVAEVTEKLDNAHAVEVTKLKEAEETKIKELGTEHETAVKAAEDATVKLKDQIEGEKRIQVKTKFNMDDEAAKSLDTFGAEQLDAMLGWTMPVAATAAAGISSTSGGVQKPQSQTEMEEAIAHMGKKYVGGAR